MIDQKHCPICRVPAAKGCAHLALASEGRDFVRLCIEKCQALPQWHQLCSHRRLRQPEDWSPEQEDFTWLETAFCSKFLRHLTWFGGLDHEWRSGPKPGQGGFWVLLWSKNPQRLWWELRDEIEKQSARNFTPLVIKPPLNSPDFRLQT